jgi:hypothetical protein
MNLIVRIAKQITVMIVVAGLCITVAESWAAEKKLPRRVIVADEGGRSEPIHRVSIKSKLRGALITTGGAEYAEVIYRNSDGVRKACRITITRIHNNASWEWSPGGTAE